MKKLLREGQITYVPGIHGGLCITLSFVTLETGSWLYVVLSCLFIMVLILWNKGFYAFLKKYIKFTAFFLVMLVNAILAPILAIIFSDSPLLEFVFMMMIPVGAVLLSLFLMKTYTVERMRRDGWEIVED